MATIGSQAQQDGVKKLIGGGYTWIGLWSGSNDKCFKEKNQWVSGDGELAGQSGAFGGSCAQLNIELLNEKFKGVECKFDYWPRRAHDRFCIRK